MTEEYEHRDHLAILSREMVHVEREIYRRRNAHFLANLTGQSHKWTLAGRETSAGNVPGPGLVHIIGTSPKEEHTSVVHEERFCGICGRDHTNDFLEIY